MRWTICDFIPMLKMNIISILLSMLKTFWVRKLVPDTASSREPKMTNAIHLIVKKIFFKVSEELAKFKLTIDNAISLN